MSVISAPTNRKPDTSTKSLPWRRMAWVTWRQHRLPVGCVVVFMGAVAVYMWRVGVPLHRAHSAASACDPNSPVCADLISRFNFMNHALQGGYALQAAPALIGAFIGAPLLARELETGTFRYAWTQAFGRWRWALAKLVALAVTLTAASAALSVLVAWYYTPYFAVGNQRRLLDQASPFDGGLFDLRGVTFAAWTLTAFSIGSLAGVLIRRVVPAIVATLAAYTALAVVAASVLRQRYRAPLVTHSSSVPGSAWVTSRWWTKGGRVMFTGRPPAALLDHLCAPGRVGPLRKPSQRTFAGCLSQHGYTQWTRYHPATQFWSFQWIETSWLFALSAVLIVGTIWVVRRGIA
jgi:hypothetical protein